LYQLEKLEHDARAALRIRSGPAGLRPLRIGNGMRNLGLFGERDLGLDLACIGVENVAEATGGSLNGFAAYKMANLTHGSHSSDFLKRPPTTCGISAYFGSIFAAFPQWVTRWASYPGYFSFTNG
jgi:hypothetical protein